MNQSECNQVVQCAHPSQSVFLIYSAYIASNVMVLIYFIAKTSLTVIDSRCKYPRKLIHQFFLLLYTISNFAYFLGVYIQYSQRVYQTLRSVPTLLFQICMVIYLSIWTKMTIQLRNKNGRSKSILYVDIFFSLSMIVFSGVFISLVLLDLSNSTISVLKVYFFLALFGFLIVAYLETTISFLRILKLKFSTHYVRQSLKIKLISGFYVTALIIRVILNIIYLGEIYSDSEGVYIEFVTKYICELFSLILTQFISFGTTTPQNTPILRARDDQNSRINFPSESHQ